MARPRLGRALSHAVYEQRWREVEETLSKNWTLGAGRDFPPDVFQVVNRALLLQL